MKSHENHDASVEFRITYSTWDDVYTDEMFASVPPAREPALEEVAAFAVRRLLDGAGPNVVSVTVEDTAGVRHGFDVHVIHGECVAERRTTERHDR